MTRRAMQAALLCAALVPACVSAAAPAPDAQAGTAPDAARMWETFLATADIDAVDDALGSIDEVDYNGETVDAALCAQKAGVLEKALATAPVSLALHRAAYLCAIARQDEAAADREMAALAALSRHALQQAGDPQVSAPIPVLWPSDAYALLRTAGLERRYEYYQLIKPKRHFPLVLAAWDPQRKTERHLAFDYVEPMYRITRKSRLAGYPILRHQIAKDFVEGGNRGGYPAAVDNYGLRRSLEQASVPDQLAKLRAAASQNGVVSAVSWMLLCGDAGPDGCHGVLDVLLEQAEGGMAMPMVTLATAYHEGVDTKADPATAWQLLERAEKTWPHALAEFTATRRQMNPEAPLPAELQRRLQASADAGNRASTRMLIRLKVAADKPVLTAREQAFLAEPAENRMGEGYQALATYFDAIGDAGQAWSWRIKAAEAGHRDAQARYAWALIYGQASQVRADMAAGRAMAERAAQAGDAWAAREVAYRHSLAGEFVAAEGWLWRAAVEDDADAVFALASMYELERPGVDGKADRAVEMYRQLLGSRQHGAQARRRLASMAADGRGMAKEPARALEWLRADAEADDHESQVLLAGYYLNGQLGAVDERQGRRWMQRAMEAGHEVAFNEWATWLYYGKNSPEARQEAMGVLGKALAAGNSAVVNNYAWFLCTSADPAVFDAARGLEVVAHLGPVDSLDPADLDTVAACHAANGDFRQAVALQERAAKAMRLLESPAAGRQESEKPPGYEQRLALYRDGKRYEESGANE